ncbi:MAG TPA: hypothetical protein VHK91_14420 [Flavisolibacter sp.]|jgi:hypothetical protein|nr:hypothetical protein [Flavisolibacter sp.]
MKKIFTLLVAFVVLSTSFAAVVPPVKKASEIYLPIGTGKQISLLDLSTISVKDFETVSGREMKFADKIGFKMAQRELRKSINQDGTLDSKKLNKFFKKADMTSGFHLGGFALGFLLGLIGVLIAYLINDDKKSSRVKWAWLGLAAWIVLLLIFVVL